MKSISDKELEAKGYRIKKPREYLASMRGHNGVCLYCGSIVKMGRDHETMHLNPDHCWCLQCGQQYFMIIDDIRAWEEEQWKQKYEDRQHMLRNEQEITEQEIDG